MKGSWLRVRATAPTAPPPLIITDDGDVKPAPIPDGWAPFLVTVPNVEILEVGEDWETSTGKFTWDEEDLQSCVASQSDPAVRTPVLKLGHTDPRFDGQPSFGRLENMRTTNNGQTLVADLVGVPKWLADIMPVAYPRRSIEGEMNATTRTGNTWAMVIEALSLLGAAYPAVNTLEDLPMVFGADVPVLVPAEDQTGILATSGKPTEIKARKVEPVKWRRNGTSEEVNASGPSARVEAQATLDDVRQAFYDSLGPAQMWWWIRSVLINPLQIVVDDDEGGLWLVDVTIDADDNVTFADPVAVKVEYVAAAKQNGLSRPGQLIAAAFGSADEAGARPRATIPAEDNAPNDQDSSNQTSEEDIPTMTPEQLKAIGLAEGATDAEITARLTELAARTEQPADDGNEQSQPQTPATEPTAQPSTGQPGSIPDDAGQQPDPAQPQSGLQIPEGMALIDSAQLQEIQESIAASKAEREARTKAEHDSLLADAVKAGKFPRSRMEHYKVLLSSDPAGTKDLIQKMAPGLIPVSERGIAGETDPQAAGAATYPEGWKPTVAATRKRAGVGTRVKVGND